MANERVGRLTDADGAASDGGLSELFGNHFGGGFVIDCEGHPCRRVRDDGLGARINAFHLVDILKDKDGAAIGPEIPHALLQGAALRVPSFNPPQILRLSRTQRSARSLGANDGREAAAAGRL